MVQESVSSPAAPLAAQLAERASLVCVTFATQQVSCSAFACFLIEDLFHNVLVCCPPTGRRLSAQGACSFVTHSCTGREFLCMQLPEHLVPGCAEQHSIPSVQTSSDGCSEVM